jgi:phenylalanyl-tRNA synthetase beta chain
VVCDKEIPVGNMVECIMANGGKYLKNCSIFDIYTGHHIAEGKKSVAFSLTMRSEEQTLTDDHAEETVKAVLTALERDFAAVMR